MLHFLHICVCVHMCVLDFFKHFLLTWCILDGEDDSSDGGSVVEVLCV